MADTADKAEKKPTDPLKAFCLVLGVLTLVLFGLWIKLRGDRNDYVEANVRAEQFLTGKGIAAKTTGDVPTTIPDIAFDVERYVETYKTASGGAPGDSKNNLSLEMMADRATRSNVKQIQVSGERVETNKAKGHQTISRTFDYDTTSIRNLLTLVWNVETIGRYKVSEIRWQLADKKDNSQPPYNLITKPAIKVSMRVPVQKEH